MLGGKESELSWGSQDLITGDAVKHFYNPKCVKLCVEDCGALTDWDTELAHCWATVGFPRAFMAMCIQRDIMRFLFQAMDKLRDGAEDTGSVKGSTLVAAGLRGSGCEALWSSYTTSAFAPPVNFDPHMLLQKAEARLHMILDGIELKQTDPTVMRGAL